MCKNKTNLFKLFNSVQWLKFSSNQTVEVTVIHCDENPICNGAAIPSLKIFE